MAGTDVKALRAAMQECIEHLKNHQTKIQGAYEEISRHWEMLNPLFSGDAADQFRVSWQMTCDQFDQYNEMIRNVELFLSERIGYLDAFIQPGEL